MYQKKELIYTIDKLRSNQENILVIKIEEAEKDGFLFKPITTQKTLYEETLISLQSPKDQTLLPFLIDQEKNYLKKIKKCLFDRRNTPLNFIHIDHQATAQLFRLFALSGKLYFNGKALVVDLFGRIDFYYSVNVIESKQIITGHLKREATENVEKQDFPIDSCDFVGRGSPHWYIKGVNLKNIFTETSWKDLKAAFDGNPSPLEDLIKESNLDPTAPKVIGDTSFAVSLSDPLPVLMLKNNTGAFGDLYMDYGNQSPFIPFHDIAPSKENKKRNMPSELLWEKDLLETDFIKKTVGSSHYYCPVDMVAKSVAFLIEIGWNVRDWKNNKVVTHHLATLLAEQKDEKIIIKGKLHYGEFEADLTHIIGAFNRRERFVEIALGHVALLPNSFEKLGIDTLIEEGYIVGDEVHIQKHHIGTLNNLFEKQPGLIIDSNLSELKEKIESFDGLKKTLPGSAFTGVLRNYQQEGLNWLSFLYEYGFHGMLADDMGLGKTVQVLAFLSTIQLKSEILIVVPTSLLFNWKREIEKFLPNYEILIHHGSKRNKDLNKNAHHDQPRIILTTYTILKIDFLLFSKTTYHCIILDEAQMIKNHKTQNAQTLSKLEAQFKLSITGTPIENHLNELWSHFHFLMPDLLSDEASFNSELTLSQCDFRYLKRIKKMIRPFILRRKKEDVAKDLPEKIEQTIYLEMGDEQRKLYEQFLSGVRSQLIKKVSADGLIKTRFEVLEAIMRLRQICCHPALINQEGMIHCDESPKLEAMLLDIETVISENRKVIIYSQFTSMLSLIRERIKILRWNFVYLDGSTQDREKVVTQFQEDPDTKIFLISLKAGGIGLNLTAADYVFLYDPWWNESIENQAIDRAHRIGRKDTVFAKRYIIAESIEEKMMKLKSHKKALGDQLLDDEGIALSLSQDDLLFLLS